MTLQDYLETTQDSINSFFTSFGPVLANLVAAVVLLVIGLVVGAILKRVWVEVMKALNLEKNLSGFGLYQRLTKTHDGLDVTTFFGELLRWLAFVIFLIPAVDAVGVEGTSEVVGSLLSYLPNVVLAGLFLTLGFVFSWFAHRLVMAFGLVVERNPAHLIADFVALAIIVFALIQALLQLGISDEMIRFLVLASFAAIALSFGLAGKDSASGLVKKFMERAEK